MVELTKQVQFEKTSTLMEDLSILSPRSYLNLIKKRIFLKIHKMDFILHTQFVTIVLVTLEDAP